MKVFNLILSAHRQEVPHRAIQSQKRAHTSNITEFFMLRVFNAIQWVSKPHSQETSSDNRQIIAQWDEMPQQDDEKNGQKQKRIN